MVARPGDRAAAPVASPATVEAIRELSDRSGIERVHMLAWRDLDDVEAGGSEVHAHNIASLWAQADIEVMHRTSFAAGRPQHVRRNGYAVVRKAGRYMVFPRSVLAELAGRNGHRDALVEIWNGVPFMSPLWCRGPHAVWLHHVHGPMWQMSLPPGLARAGRLLEEKVAPRFYRRTPIVTLSNSSRDEMVAEMGFDADRITVVPPGVDQRFTPGPTKTQFPHVLAVGRLVPVKNFARLLGVMAAVRRRVPDAYLTIVGDGYEREMLTERIDQLGARDYVRLVGRVDDDDLLELYRSAWVVASTSIREGWGMTLTEAAACGTPCVATRIAGHLDATVDGEAGILGDTDDELVAGLVEVLTDSDRRERMSKAAIDRASELTWEAAAVATFRVLADTAIPAADAGAAR